MAQTEDPLVIITEPGVLVFGEGLPDRSSIAPFQDETIVQMSCGTDHSTLVCESGQVYTFCVNQGNERMMNEGIVIKPRLINSLSGVRVTHAVSGYRYSLFLTDKGELYSSGQNDNGQLGLGHTRKTLAPVLVVGLPPIKMVTAGWHHTVVLSDSGEVWVCGYNGNGQLGLGHRNDQTSLTRVPNLPDAIIDISCGTWHTALVSTSGILLMAGWNKYGQLGLGFSDPASLHSFTQISVPTTTVAAVSCGAYHTVALGVNGTTWAWGINAQGHLGTGDTTYRSAPTRMIGLEDQTISQVIAGFNHTAMLTREGDVFVCGQGTSDLWKGKENLLVATLLPKSPGLIVQQVAFAQKYSLLLVLKSIVTPSPQLETVDIAERAGGPATELEQRIMQYLECPVCFKIMCAPIHQCTEGHSLCNACWSDDKITVCPLCRGQFIAGRNLIAEGLSADIQLPCTECLLRMPACELEGHSAICPRRN